MNLNSAVQIDDRLENLVKKVINCKGEDGILLVEIFNVEYVNVHFNRHLIEMEKIFKPFQDKKGIDIVDFLYVMLNSMKYKANETIFVALALIDFF